MKIQLLSSDASHLEAIKAVLAGKATRHDLAYGSLELLATPDALLKAAPDLLLVEGIPADGKAWPQLEHMVAAAPQLVTAIISPNQTPEFLRQAMRAGVREVLVPGTGELAKLVNRVEQQLVNSGGLHRGHVLAFLPAKGAGGATFLATSLAYALSNQLGKKVLLIDLNLQLGDAVYFLSDQQPAFTLSDVCEQIHRLDASFLTASALQAYPNLHVLAAPDEPEKALKVKPEHLRSILKVAVTQYDFVLLDVDRALDAVSLTALDNAEAIFPVIQQSLPFLRDASRLAKVFAALGYPAERVHLIVNRASKGEQISLEQIEKSLGMKVYRAIPNHYRQVVSAINQGIPLAKLEPGHPVAQMVKEIAGDITHTAVDSKSWLQRLLHH